MTWDQFLLVLLAMARSPFSASKVYQFPQQLSLIANYPQRRWIYRGQHLPCPRTGANAISWAPSVLSTVSGVSRSQQPSNSLAPQKRFVTAGSDNLIRIWGFDEEQKKWTEEETIKGHEDWVRDVAWAPNIGLPGMYIASASQVINYSECGEYLVTHATLLRTEPCLSTPAHPPPLPGHPLLSSPAFPNLRTLISPMPSGVLAGHSPETFSPSAAVMVRSACGRKVLERDGSASVISRARLINTM